MLIIISINRYIDYIYLHSLNFIYVYNLCTFFVRYNNNSIIFEFDRDKVQQLHRYYTHKHIAYILLILLYVSISIKCQCMTTMIELLNIYLLFSDVFH